jgi:hypothetical protein
VRRTQKEIEDTIRSVLGSAHHEPKTVVETNQECPTNKDSPLYT